MKTFGDRVRERREELGMSQEGLGKAAGISQSTIAQIERGRNQGTKHILALARALGLTPEWLETGKGTKHISTRTGVPGIDPEGDLIKQLLPEDKGNVVVWERPEDLEPDEGRVWIDRYDYRFSAGSGVIQWEVRQKKALPFDIGYFKALGSNPKDCKLAIVHGDSMEFYLFNRDTMLIDTAKTNIRDGHVYAIYFEDEPLVKQIFKEAGGGIRLHSLNPKYLDKVVAPEYLERVIIAGEVIGRSGSGFAGGN